MNFNVDIGARKPLGVRTFHIDRFPSSTPFKLLYISDLHLSFWTNHIVEQVVDIVKQTDPNVVVLGGDMVDKPSGLQQLVTCIQILSTYCDVYAIEGNHDVKVGLEEVKRTICDNGGKWLHNNPQQYNNITISAECTPQKKDTYSILCAHYPDIYANAFECNYNLVLAGHLHGSQAALFSYKEHTYPGGLFFKWNGDIFKKGNTTMIVSKGVNDTIPIRFNCAREVILCEIS